MDRHPALTGWATVCRPIRGENRRRIRGGCYDRGGMAGKHRARPDGGTSFGRIRVSGNSGCSRQRVVVILPICCLIIVTTAPSKSWSSWVMDWQRAKKEERRHEELVRRSPRTIGNPMKPQRISSTSWQLMLYRALNSSDAVGHAIHAAGGRADPNAEYRLQSQAGFRHLRQPLPPRGLRPRLAHHHRHTSSHGACTTPATSPRCRSWPMHSRTPAARTPPSSTTAAAPALTSAAAGSSIWCWGRNKLCEAEKLPAHQ